MNLASAITAGTHLRLGLGLRAGSLALLTQHRGVHRDGLADTGECLIEAQRNTQQRICTWLHTRAALAGTAGTAEECLEDIADSAAAETAEATAWHTALRVERISSHIHNPALFRIQQDLVRFRGLTELLRSFFITRITVWVVLERQLSVRLFNLSVRSVLLHSEDAVIVACQL